MAGVGFLPSQGTLFTLATVICILPTASSHLFTFLLSWEWIHLPWLMQSVSSLRADSTDFNFLTFPFRLFLTSSFKNKTPFWNQSETPPGVLCDSATGSSDASGGTWPCSGKACTDEVHKADGSKNASLLHGLGGSCVRSTSLWVANKTLMSKASVLKGPSDP